MFLLCVKSFTCRLLVSGPHLIISNNVREVVCWIHELHIFLMHIKSINYENTKSWFVCHLKSSCLRPSPTLWGNLSLEYRSDTSTWPTRPSGTCWCVPLHSLSLFFSLPLPALIHSEQLAAGPWIHWAISGLGLSTAVSFLFPELCQNPHPTSF